MIIGRRLVSHQALFGGAPQQVFLVADGDSITAGYPTLPHDSYAQIFFDNNTLYATGINTGSSGHTLANKAAKNTGGLSSNDVMALPPSFLLAVNAHQGRGVYSLLIGANDLGTYAGATDADAAANYITDLQAQFTTIRNQTADFSRPVYLVACTILPRTGSLAAPNPDFENRRQIVNADIPSWVGTYIDAYVDFASDPTFGTTYAATADTGLYYDGIHPTAAVMQSMCADYFSPVMSTIGQNAGSQTTQWVAPASGITVSADGLVATGPTPATWYWTKTSVPFASGKSYIEVLGSQDSDGEFLIGGVDGSPTPGAATLGSFSTSYGYENAIQLATGVTGHLTAPGTTVGGWRIYGHAYDTATGNGWIRLNGTWLGGGDPAAGTNPSYTGGPSTWYPAIGLAGTGAAAFTATLRSSAERGAYAPPSGFSWLG